MLSAVPTLVHSLGCKQMPLPAWNWNGKGEVCSSVALPVYREDASPAMTGVIKLYEGLLTICTHSSFCHVPCISKTSLTCPGRTSKVRTVLNLAPEEALDGRDLQSFHHETSQCHIEL